MKRLSFAILFCKLFLFMFLSQGCGGYISSVAGSEEVKSQSSFASESAQDFIVSAGDDFNLTGPVSFVALEGQLSDPSSKVSSLRWTQVAGPAQVSINSSNQLTASLSNLTVAGSYTFKLTARSSERTATAMVKLNLVTSPAAGAPGVQQPQPNPNPVVSPVNPTPGGLTPINPSPGSPAIVSSYSCEEDVAKLGWQNLASKENVQVTFAPAGNPDYEALGFPATYPLAVSMMIYFYNPYRPGSTTYFRNNIDYSADGYRIEIKDNTTNAAINVLGSDISNETGISNTAGLKVSATVAGTAPDSTGKFQGRDYNLAWFHLYADFYKRIENYGVSTVNLYCKNSLVATGQQDVQSLKRGMATGVMRSTQYAPGKYGYTLDPSTPSLQASFTCPYEVEAGASAICGVNSLELVSGTWYIDGVAKENFTATKPSAGYPASANLIIPYPGKGTKQVRVLVTYKDGTSEMRQINLVKFK